MARIFVSYRRQETAGHAGRIYDRLRAFFGSGRVFMDVEGIDLGADFARTLDDRIAGAEVMVVVIGPQWLGVKTADGRKRLFAEGDYVRHEIAAALERGIEVLPVLVADAEPPHASELPADLGKLAGRQMYRISDAAMDAGIARLIRGVEHAAARTREARRLAPRPQVPMRERWWARLLLLYEPRHPAMWLLHILFFGFLLLTAIAPLGMWWTGEAGGGGLRMALTILLGMAVWLLLIRGVVLALEPDAVVSPLRRWLLLYNPPRALMGLVHLAFLMMVLLCLTMGLGVLVLVKRQPNDLARANPVQAWIFLVVLTLIVREIGVSRDPLRPALSEPSLFARLLCLWKPQRPVAWLPRMLYYAACFLIFFELPKAFVGKDGNLATFHWAGSQDHFLILALLLGIAVAARGAAHALEVGWPDFSDANVALRAKSALLLFAPWRRAGWLATSLCFSGLAVLVAAVTTYAGPHILPILEPKVLPALAVLSALLVLCAWGWAQLYRPPVHSGEGVGGASEMDASQ